MFPNSSKRQRLDPGPETILFVPYTPNSALRKEIQEVENIINAGDRTSKVKVVERNGVSLENQLCNRTPWRQQECKDKECIPCAGKPGSCRSRNLTYRLVCARCAAGGVSSVYIGETHRAWGDRAREHTRALHSRDKTYATIKHQIEFHPEYEPAYTYHIIGAYKSSIERQIEKAFS